MFLVDTNVWLEILLDQEQAATARDFLAHTEANRFFVTDFTLYSIGIILSRFGRDAAWARFLDDTLHHAGVHRIGLSVECLKEIPRVKREHGLDFDDAYQYVAATHHDLTIVSFDQDFDATPLGRLSPADAGNAPENQ